jgi:hypothetical protein
LNNPSHPADPGVGTATTAIKAKKDTVFRFMLFLGVDRLLPGFVAPNYTAMRADQKMAFAFNYS